MESGNTINGEVRFAIQDVYFPEPEAVLKELHGKSMLEGRVLAMSKGGSEGEMFAVVEVEGLAQPLIVPVGCLKEKQ